MIKEEIPQLSTRERQILALKASGYTCKEIGTRLSIRESTVHGHLCRVYLKLHAENDVHAAAIGILAELITPDMIEAPAFAKRIPTP